MTILDAKETQALVKILRHAREAASVMSDVQELIRMGIYTEANEQANHAKRHLFAGDALAREYFESQHLESIIGSFLCSLLEEEEESKV